MLLVRVLLGLIGIALVLSILGYAVNHDPRWLRFVVLLFKIGIAFTLLILLALMLERLLMVV